MPHLTEGELAGYLDQDLSNEGRQGVERHLEECDECRAELLAVAGLVDGWNAGEARDEPEALPPAPRATRRRWGAPLGLVGLAAAAALAAILLVGPGTDLAVENGRDLERFSAEGVAPLSTHAPRDAGVVGRDELQFVWADHGTDSYRLTITAEDGALLWSVSLADTVATPPASLELERGARFFWYVDAMSAGVVARSGVRSFVVVP